MSLHLSTVSFSYSSAVPVVVDASVDLGAGWAGVVGPNGSGKTTLLRLMAGEIEPDSGTVTSAQPNAVVVLCPQRVDQAGQLVISFSQEWDASSARLRGVLGLDPDDLTRWETLSPGERRRWQVGAALAREPDVLLLDEPTNHLDREARDRLVSALVGYRGVGVVVSHDRGLLDELTSVTLRVEGGHLERWSGGYTVAREAWLADEAERAEAFAVAKRERSAATGRLDAAARGRAQAEATAKREQRTAGIKDPDTRGAARTGRVRSAEKTLGREVTVAKRDLARAEERVGSFEHRRELGGEIALEFETAPKEWVAQLDLDLLVAGPKSLAADLHLGVRRTDRIRVSGVNGAGKTTLLQALVARAAIPDDRILWLPQEVTGDESRMLMDRIRTLPSDRLGVLMSLVAALGVDPGRLLDSGRPSPGEARKVLIACGLATSVWLAVLDEPTNHLDLPSIERLEDALASYGGALVLVTHDDAFAGGLVDTEWRIADGRVQTTRGVKGAVGG